jgi:hypothetical protein
VARAWILLPRASIELALPLDSSSSSSSLLLREKKSYHEQGPKRQTIIRKEPHAKLQKAREKVCSRADQKSEFAGIAHFRLNAAISFVCAFTVNRVAFDIVRGENHYDQLGNFDREAMQGTGQCRKYVVNQVSRRLSGSIEHEKGIYDCRNMKEIFFARCRRKKRAFVIIIIITIIIIAFERSEISHRCNIQVNKLIVDQSDCWQ